MSCLPVVIAGVSPEGWKRIKDAALLKLGFEVSTDQGFYDGHGFRVTWDYVPPGTLTFTVLESPLLLACDYINQMIEHGIRSL